MANDPLMRRVNALSKRVSAVEQRTAKLAPINHAHAVELHLRGADLSRVQAEAVAASLGMTAVTLQRRLADEGLKFQGMLDAERRRRVLAFLDENPKATANELTDIAQYGEHQTLVRSFRRWFGCTITEYKRTHIEVLDT